MADQTALNLDGRELCADCGRSPGYLAGPTADLPAGSTCGRAIFGSCNPPRVLGEANRRRARGRPAGLHGMRTRARGARLGNSRMPGLRAVRLAP